MLTKNKLETQWESETVTCGPLERRMAAVPRRHETPTWFDSPLSHMERKVPKNYTPTLPHTLKSVRYGSQTNDKRAKKITLLKENTEENL